MYQTKYNALKAKSETEQKEQQKRTDDLSTEVQVLNTQNKQLQDSYKEEVIKRKRFYNMLEDMKVQRMLCVCYGDVRCYSVKFAGQNSCVL